MGALRPCGQTATRFGAMTFWCSEPERHRPVFVVVPRGYVGPALIRRDLARAAAFGRTRTSGWWYLVDTTAVRLPNPLNAFYVRRIRRLPNVAGYIVTAPSPVLRLAARLLRWVSTPDAITTSRQNAFEWIETNDASSR